MTVGRNLGRAEGIWNFVKQCCGRLRRAGQSAENLMAASEGKKQSFAATKHDPNCRHRQLPLSFDKQRLMLFCCVL